MNSLVRSALPIRRAALAARSARTTSVRNMSGGHPQLGEGDGLYREIAYGSGDGLVCGAIWYAMADDSRKTSAYFAAKRANKD